MIFGIYRINVFDGGQYYSFFKDGDIYKQVVTDLRVVVRIEESDLEVFLVMLLWSYNFEFMNVGL